MSPRRLLLLLGKDLLRRRRAPLGVAVMLAFPLIMAGMIALAFGGQGGGPARARLLVEDKDDGFASGFVKAALGAEQLRELLEVVEVGEEGRQLIEDGEASALLIIPERTTERLLEGEDVTFELVRNPAQSIFPEIAEETVRILTEVMTVAVRLVRQQVDLLDVDLDSLDDLSDDDFARVAVAMRKMGRLAERYLDEPPVDLEIVELGEDGQPVVAEDDAEDDDDFSLSLLIFLMVLPGVSVYALFVIGDQMMRDLLSEGASGTLRRLHAAPITAAEIVGAKVLLTALVSAVALLVLASIAAAVSPDPVDLAAFSFLALVLVLAVTGTASLVYGLAKSERQGAAVAAVVYLMMAFSSGSFIPLDSLPAAARVVAPFSLFYWGNEGFRAVLQGRGLGDVLVHGGVLAALGVVFLPLGTWLLHRKMRRGEMG